MPSCKSFARQTLPASSAFGLVVHNLTHAILQPVIGVLMHLKSAAWQLCGLHRFTAVVALADEASPRADDIDVCTAPKHPRLDGQAMVHASPVSENGLHYNSGDVRHHASLEQPGAR